MAQLRDTEIFGNLIVHGTINGSDSFLEKEQKATEENLGAIKIGYEQNEQNYPLELDKDGKAFVNIPVSGGTGDSSVKSIKTEYCLSSSSTEFKNDNPNWEMSYPDIPTGNFVWSRTTTILTDGTISYSPDENGTCITKVAEKDPTDITIKSITEEYYLSTSKTNRVDGEWVEEKPENTSGKYLWTRNKMIYSNSEVAKYSTPIISNTGDIIDEISDTLNTKTDNLVSNGSATLKNNKNFSSFIFDNSDNYNCEGSFKTYDLNTDKTIDKFIPVNTGLSYKLKYFIKADPCVWSSAYTSVHYYDVDKKEILFNHTSFIKDTLTTLSKPLENGDTVIYLKNSSCWINNSGPVDDDRRIIFWNYKNGNGHFYSALTYSRNITPSDLWEDGAINFENNSITLKEPWSGGSYKTGTQLSNGSSISSFRKISEISYTPDTQWKEHTKIIGKIGSKETENLIPFSYGTAYVKIGWFLNGKYDNGVSWLSNISFSQNTATQEDLDNVADVANSSVKTSIDEFCISESSATLVNSKWENSEPIWTTDSPIWENGKFIWRRTKLVLNNGTESYTPSETGVCISGATGSDGEKAITISIYSSNGNSFRNGTASTTLTCSVFSGAENITDELSDAYFTWERKSDDEEADEVWNEESLKIGRKTLELSPDDVNGRTVFSCNVMTPEEDTDNYDPSDYISVEETDDILVDITDELKVSQS